MVLPVICSSCAARVHPADNRTTASTATLRTTVAIPATSMLEIRLDAMNHFLATVGWSVDLESPAPAGTFRRHRYRAATRHRALPGPNSPAGSSRRATTVAGRQSRQKFANEDHRSHAGSRDRIAIHALNTGGSVCLPGCHRPRPLASCHGGAIRAEIWRDRTTILSFKKPMQRNGIGHPLSILFVQYGAGVSRCP